MIQTPKIILEWLQLLKRFFLINSHGKHFKRYYQGNISLKVKIVCPKCPITIVFIDFYIFKKSYHLPSKSTSPTNLGLAVMGSWILFIPTSMTAAPSLIISAVIRFGMPRNGDRNDRFSTRKEDS